MSSQPTQHDHASEVVPFLKFQPLIIEIRSILSEIIDIAQAAELNKRICDVLKLRVYAVDLTTFELNVKRDKQEFFNKKNYSTLQSLVAVITQIKRFTTAISQIKNILNSKYVYPNNIEMTFKELCKEFDICIFNIDFASFRDTVNSKINIEDENKSLKSDREDLSNYLTEFVKFKSDIKENIEEVGSDVRAACNEISSLILTINAMNNTMEKILDEQTKHAKHDDKAAVNEKLNETTQSKIDRIFTTYRVSISDYEETGEKRQGGRVTRWVKIKNKSEEFAFKTITDEEKFYVQNQVTILKEFHDWQNIARIYGLTCEGNKWYLISEWAKYGNLREFYQNERFNPKLKLRMSLDIARGLNFLRAADIVHRDIRAENILITLHETAKLANFKLSRALSAISLNQAQSLERVRYCAPELLERAPNFRYDHRCEVYSFGVLLWEIAEERTPFEDFKDIIKLTELVRKNKQREPFSDGSQMPKSFIDLAMSAVNHDPEFRPKITATFDVLHRCYEEYEKPSKSNYKKNILLSSPEPIPGPESIINQDEYAIKTLPDYESFKYMTLAEAAKQHKIIDRYGKINGDIKTAYKCFEAYADGGTPSNKIVAKYYKAYYISRGYVENIKDKERDRIVAELYKEVADDEANEFPEAKLRYGDCLYNGKGVEKNVSEALKYFEQAADNGFKVAMYNVGKIYYNSDDFEKNKEKALKYMRLAVYNDYDPAIKFCKDNGISLTN